MLKKLWFVFESHPKLMPKWLQKWTKNAEHIGTCDFSIFAKSITLKSFFGTINAIQIGYKINKNQSDYNGWKNVAKIIPKVVRSESKMTQHGVQIGRKSAENATESSFRKTFRKWTMPDPSADPPPHVPVDPGPTPPLGGH